MPARRVGVRSRARALAGDHAFRLGDSGMFWTTHRDSDRRHLVQLVRDELEDMELPSVAYIAPINHVVVGKTLGEGAREHLARSAALVEAAYREAAGAFGTVVNAVSSARPASTWIRSTSATPAGCGSRA